MKLSKLELMKKGLLKEFPWITMFERHGKRYSIFWNHIKSRLTRRDFEKLYAFLEIRGYDYGLGTGGAEIIFWRKKPK